VTVPEADVCACCGTHLHYTGEIGYIKLISAEKHKNGVRIEMLAGQRAENYMRRIMDQNSEVSHLLSAKVFETGAAVEKLLQASLETRQKLRILSERAMAAAAEQLPEGEAVQIAFAEDADHDSLRHFANLIMEKKKPAAAAALCADEKECRYVMISSSIPLRKGIREINQALNGRGGGNDEMVQGMFHAPKEEIVKILEQQLKALM
jgi:alanyl-tRNA synthetase